MDFQGSIERNKSYVIETEGQFNGISNITAKKKSVNHNTEFLERFQGRQSLMNKEGHIGVVKNAKQPIVKRVEKVELSQNLLKQSMKQSKNRLNTEAKPSVGLPRFHARDDSRFTTTPLPKSHGQQNYGQMLSNDHEMIETPMSVNRPKFDFNKPT